MSLKATLISIGIVLAATAVAVLAVVAIGVRSQRELEELEARRLESFRLAEELQELSERARIRRLRPEDLQGGSFSISSLGGIGGTFFTPIVNHPEVAILGVSRMEWKPVWSGSEFVPRLILPLSLSYDHRVIDGADAVRFTTRLCEVLADPRGLVP